MTVGQRIKELRARSRLKQSDLADRIGITQTAVSLWETDKALLTMWSFVQLCKALNVGMDEFMKGVDL